MMAHDRPNAIFESEHAAEKHPLHHVRPAALGLSLLLRPPTLATPNIDALARRGVRFTHAYVQSPVCGASRMSFYTGRYMQSHGAHWNGLPLKVGEMTLGDYLRPLGVRNVLVGKTHMRADREGMKRLGIEPDSIIGVRVAECGFDPYERDDGLHPDAARPRPRYNDYLDEQGYDGDNPWQDWANSGEGDGRHAARLAAACMPTRPRACPRSIPRRPT